ncbi:MAG TPA: peptidoglycan editing factor PgeF [Alphaproteobacteria bacterium]|nr:peptidoglycan editing factor PgeF [Alphaproteobacteria bacterium]
MTAPSPIESEVLTASAGIRHGFFTREGGVSSGAYATLNCGLGSGDDPQMVRENRRRAMAVFGLGGVALVTAHQIHSPTALVVETPWPLDARPQVDGLVTRRPGIALGVLAADCTPVLFAAPDSAVVGAAHAGWRGALGGILEATVDAMVGLGADRKLIRAAIGPTIAQASYEVGPEFPAPFLARNPSDSAFFAPSARAGHFMFDLPGYVASRLGALSLGAVDQLAYDTYTEPTRFFSYRRNTHEGIKDYGRGLSAIALI